ncbi:uncharacterized protein PHALS_03412 [Plasmopara halstedii]|uniref:RxLR-like protein n=1 Tax=Plasmopara halstedii TaxID=4781 RepID=A0A0P1AZW7_PLAHL|nr:uncharacterized protein PHALS_03412 [Plasmopara halstedii]CEG46727.1 hypothetical protein PHALS_03412 [Plasmopara halstedii]|eukprot:XP_024583096.1 hypothetical protein PHALS_03412 [Plasmopara halstedii]
MTLRQQQFRCLFTAVIVQLCAAVPSTDFTLKACSYALENFYIVNSTNPNSIFPNGYVTCANATGSDAILCSDCSCREKKVESVGGVTIAWIVCLRLEDASICESIDTSAREFCGTSVVSFSQESSGSNDILDVDVEFDTSSTMGSINGSDASAESWIDFPNASVEFNSVGDNSDERAETSLGFKTVNSSISSGTSTTGENLAKNDIGLKTNGTINVGKISSFNISKLVSNSTANATETATSALPSMGSGSQGSDGINIIAADAGTVHSKQTNITTMIEEQAIQPSDNETTQHLDTNNGSSSKSDWTDTRLLAILTLIGGFAAIAVLSVIIAVRKNQASDDFELGTPTEDDNSRLAMPVTQRFNEKRYPRRTNTGQIAVGSSTISPVVVVGADKNYLSGHHHRYFSEAEAFSNGFARFEHAQASNGEVRLDFSHYNAVSASQLQFNTSHGPSVPNLLSSALYPIYDTSNTHVRFSSSLSSDCALPSSECMFESDESSVGSYRYLEEKFFEDRSRGSEILRASRNWNSEQQMSDLEIYNSTKSFASSLSSYEYATRDTEASEHMHPSELGTSSCCMAMSFDVESGSVSGGHSRLKN